jgi:CBS domain-containing protein
MVVLKPDSSACGVTRAIEHNRIGAVVQDKGRVIGVVTDHDLAVRVLGARPRRTDNAGRRR